MERRKVARLTSIEGVDGWKKLHLIEKRRRSRGGNVEKSRFPIFPMTINSLKADAGMGAASDVVFKLFPSTLIGNLLLKESSISLLLDAVDSALEVLTCTCCVRDSRLPLSAPTTKLETFFASSFFFVSHSTLAHTHSSLSPYWHWAIKYLCWRFFLLPKRFFLFDERKKFRRSFCLLAFLCSLNRTCTLSAFLCRLFCRLVVASSQLCGAIDFNNIDFLCHYQPLASLRLFFFFFWFCAQKCFCIGMARAKATAQKKHKIQKKRASTTSEQASDIHTAWTIWRGEYSIVMLM